MGILDGMFGGSAANQGLLAGSAALMASGGPSRMPVSLGQGMSQALMAGQQAYQQAQEQKLQNDYRNAQIKKMQTDAEAKTRMDTMLQGLLSGGGVAGGPPADVLEKAGTAMLFGGDPRGSGVLELAKQKRAAAEKTAEMQSMTASGTTNSRPP